jgi:hypothetical protein
MVSPSLISNQLIKPVEQDNIPIHHMTLYGVSQPHKQSVNQPC